MRIDPTCFNSLVIAAAAAVTPVGAPKAGAAPTPPEGRLVIHPTSTCQGRGVAEIARPRPSVTVHSYGTMSMLTGGH